jgi:translation elongation factor EF-Tu-like GTPase
MEEEKKLIGKVVHYFAKIGVAVIELSDALEVGDEIAVEGAVTNIKQTVESMEVEHKKIDKAKAGDSVGLKTIDRVREKDNVYKVVPQTP